MALLIDISSDRSPTRQDIHDAYLKVTAVGFAQSGNLSVPISVYFNEQARQDGVRPILQYGEMIPSGTIDPNCTNIRQAVYDYLKVQPQYSGSSDV